MRLVGVILLSCFSFFSLGQEYNVKVDLKAIKDDQVPVEIKLEGFDLKNSIEFQMPKMIPGTYSISDFGRVVKSLEAFDADGNKLEVERLDLNRWSIQNADKLSKINYWVEDTFDDKKYTEIFEPGGSNFEEENYLLNTFAIIGFLEGYTKSPYKIKVIHPDQMYGASPMKREVLSDSEDLFFSHNYLQLTDSPIMYTLPDTASVMIGDTKVEISVYSPSGKSTAAYMMEMVEPTLRAQGEYLGGELPVDKYVILIYLHGKRTNSGSMGALEHSYSTVFSFPDYEPSYLASSIVSTTSHEFFHVITPLTIHSEEIGDFDFSDAQMSEHLWLYEGLTEYSSMRVQVMYDLIGPNEFLDEIVEKMDAAKAFNDTLPFTVMSKGVLDRYEDQYLNVYQKGALIGMCLDLLLLELSDGEYDIRTMMSELSEMYGINNSFKDEELFDVIASISYPETMAFFNDYVAGNKALPIKEYLEFVGVGYMPGELIKVNSLGNLAIGFNPDEDQIVIADVGQKGSYSRKLGLKDGDILERMLGQKMTMDNYREIFKRYFALEENEKFKLVVLRENSKGKLVSKTLKGKAVQEEIMIGEQYYWEEDISDKQLLLRRKWINGELIN
jgi:predicted metalloprotease with PDZ domain